MSKPHANDVTLVVFDLDGVLVDSRPLHHEAFNRSLKEFAGEEFVIPPEELHLYDGLPTKVKLEMLTEKKGLPSEKHMEVWKNKQALTLKVIEDTVKKDEKLVKLISELKSRNMEVWCASNSIRESLELFLKNLGISGLLDGILSNQDVTHSKPHPEIYMKVMMMAGKGPRETLVVEDNQFGRTAALHAGCHLCPVLDPASVSLGFIEAHLREARKANDRNSLTKQVRWLGTPDLNLVLPIAGAGSRFRKEGYTTIKPLIPVRGMPMIQVVARNMNMNARHIFIGQKAHDEEYKLHSLLPLIVGEENECKFLTVDGLTEGAACTTLIAKDLINNDSPLLMANSDQFVEWDVTSFMHTCMREGTDGCILTFHCKDDPKWSYAKVDENGYVTDVQEKKPISEHATVGIYFWRKGSDYVKYAEQMIAKNIRVNNEFYVAPIYNEAIQDGKKITVFDCPKMWGIGVPKDLDTFLKDYKGEV